jgi:hypothetical protein
VVNGGIATDDDTLSLAHAEFAAVALPAGVNWRREKG